MPRAAAPLQPDRHDARADQHEPALRARVQALARERRRAQRDEQRRGAARDRIRDGQVAVLVSAHQQQRIDDVDHRRRDDADPARGRDRRGGRQEQQREQPDRDLQHRGRAQPVAAAAHERIPRRMQEGGAQDGKQNGDRHAEHSLTAGNAKSSPRANHRMNASPDCQKGTRPGILDEPARRAPSPAPRDIRGHGRADRRMCRPGCIRSVPFRFLSRRVAP
ncbi:hypothetical protein BDI4_100012 [Burkholderia diffusa]|nr:hypothetical protein BDI4_100012 [Burkholderia diffusa]